MPMYFLGLLYFGVAVGWRLQKQNRDEATKETVISNIFLDIFENSGYHETLREWSPSIKHGLEELFVKSEEDDPFLNFTLLLLIRGLISLVILAFIIIQTNRPVDGGINTYWNWTVLSIGLSLGIGILFSGIHSTCDAIIEDFEANPDRENIEFVYLPTIVLLLWGINVITWLGFPPLELSVQYIAFTTLMVLLMYIPLSEYVNDN